MHIIVLIPPDRIGSVNRIYKCLTPDSVANLLYEEVFHFNNKLAKAINENRRVSNTDLNVLIVQIEDNISALKYWLRYRINANEADEPQMSVDVFAKIEAFYGLLAKYRSL